MYSYVTVHTYLCLRRGNGKYAEFSQLETFSSFSYFYSSVCLVGTHICGVFVGRERVFSFTVGCLKSPVILTIDK